MMKRPFSLAAAVLCLAASGAAAQSFEQQVAEASAAAREGARGARAAASAAFAAAAKPESPFARGVDCRPPSGSYFPSSLRYYLRLDDKTSLDEIPAEKWIGVRRDAVSPKDETKLDDYGDVSLNRSTYSIREWSCDAQDYEFTIATASLVRRGGEKTRAITVRARVETRGRADFEGELSCTAWWAAPPASGRD